MQINSASAQNAVKPMAYTPPQAQPSSSQAAGDAPGPLDELFGQLSSLLSASVASKDSSKPKALLAMLDPNGSGDTSALPQDLVNLINGITGKADAAGKGDEFKALLREYVAVKWALTELDAAIQSERDGAMAAENRDYHYQQLCEANAFMQQLSAALSQQLDSLASEHGYTNWLQEFRDDLDARSTAATGSTIPQNLDAGKLVAYLLRQAPRPDADSLQPVAQAAPAPVDAPPSNNPYH